MVSQWQKTGLYNNKWKFNLTMRSRTITTFSQHWESTLMKTRLLPRPPRNAGKFIILKNNIPPPGVSEGGPRRRPRYQDASPSVPVPCSGTRRKGWQNPRGRPRSAGPLHDGDLRGLLYHFRGVHVEHLRSLCSGEHVVATWGAVCVWFKPGRDLCFISISIFQYQRSRWEIERTRGSGIINFKSFSHKSYQYSMSNCHFPPLPSQGTSKQP